MKRILLCIIVLCGVSGLSAQNFSLDRDSILIGDQVTLSVYGPNFPTLDELNQGNIVALQQWLDTTNENNKQIIVQKTTLTCFEIGLHWLKLGNDSIQLTVNDVPNVDTTKADIRDISPIMKEPYTFWEIFRWILLAIVVAALIFGICYIVKRKKANQPIISIPKAPPLPADQKALNDLEALRLKQLWQQGRIKEYHTELTDIVRNYLEKRYGIASTEMTSDQTIEQFNNVHRNTTDSNASALLADILQTADMVKFAKSEPLPYEHDRSMNNATEFIRKAEADKSATEAGKEEQA
ncbi:MAG: hypothetical protein KBT45_05705 [Bacteroidales bacterium]|nr:hypothetical protein [Candidatus Colimorpha pelethequi]